MSEAASIEQQGKLKKKPWVKYVADVVEQYCSDMAVAQGAKRYPNKMLIYVFCLREVSRQAVYALSSEKVNRMISVKGIDCDRVEN